MSPHSRPVQSRHARKTRAMRVERLENRFMFSGLAAIPVFPPAMTDPNRAAAAHVETAAYSAPMPSLPATFPQALPAGLSGAAAAGQLLDNGASELLLVTEDGYGGYGGYGGHVNVAPQISGFTGVQGIGNYWTFSGRVTDQDDPVEGMVVNFGGVLAGYGYTATVLSDGTFSLTAEFAGLQDGWATAQTSDPHGALSNLARYEVSV